jgi:hypothetical protein
VLAARLPVQGAVPDHIKAAAERSASAAQLRAAHEAAVGGEKTPDAQLLAAYMAYIQVGDGTTCQTP